MTIYLDYNATAPIRPEVIACVAEVMASPANASSVHGYGRAAKKILEASRQSIAETISAFPNEIIFVSCGSEANAMALRGFAGRKILVSTVEHSSVLRHPGEGRDPRQSSSERPDVDSGLRRNDIIGVDSNGIIDLTALDNMLAGSPPALVSVMLTNNETGVIQPIRAVAEICKKHGALLHTDAVQALGKIPLDFTALGVDMMSIAAHKMGGPVGAAALVVRQDLAIAPLLTGGGQELRRRAGTENIAGIAGFAKAVEMIDLAQMEQLRGWLEVMEREVSGVRFQVSDTHSSDTRHLTPDILGAKAPRLPNTTCLAIPNTSQEVSLMKLDLAGFAVSAGSACSSGRIEPSHVLSAMGYGKEISGSAIRISGGWATTEAEIQAVTNALLSFTA